MVVPSGSNNKPRRKKAYNGKMKDGASQNSATEFRTEYVSLVEFATTMERSCF